MFPFKVSVMLIPTGRAALARPAENLRLGWTNNMLTISGANLPGKTLEVLYLEAFCRSGSTHRDWHQTVIPHKTELLRAGRNGESLRLRTHVEPGVEIRHEIRAGRDEVEFQLEIRNAGEEPVDVQWFQPCMRVASFTGRNQSNYIERSFIFTEAGLTTLDKARRAEEAVYRGGQVYVPADISLKDVNPRPISPDRPVNGLIGCFSEDDQSLLAMAWNDTQELFQGVIVCLHNDPRIGGLKAGERKKLHGKIYWLPNDPKILRERYRRDFDRRSASGNGPRQGRGE